MTSKTLIDSLIQERPDFGRQDGEVIDTSSSKALKDFSPAEVAGNVVILYSEKEGFMWPANHFLAYFMDTEQSAREMKAGKIDYLIFVPMRQWGYSMLSDVWKKKRQGKGSEHIVGIADGSFVDGKATIDNISVRPGWKRNSIASKIVSWVQSNFDAKELDHTPTTPEGYKFFKATGNLKHNKKDGGGEHGVPDVPRTIVPSQKPHAA